MKEASQPGRRVAFFGGSFDPPHLGHLAVALAARTALALDQVLFAPVGAQPLKPVGANASFEDRVAMTELAIAGEKGLAVSLADEPRAAGAPNYTMETLEKLKGELGANCHLYCLMGADSFAAFRKWHRAAEIPFVAPLIVASRPGEDLSKLSEHLPAALTLEEEADASDLPVCDVEVRVFWVVGESGTGARQRVPFYLLPGVDVPISASRIRELARNRELSYVDEVLLPEAVAEYIRAHGLYR